MTTTPNLTGPAIVGKFYMVPCVRLAGRSGWHGVGGMHASADKEGWVPVIGPEHHDRETLGFQPMHIHVDARFVPRRAIAYHEWSADKWRSAEQSVMTMPVSTYADGVAGEPAPIERAIRRMKCMRAMPDFPCAGHQPAWRKFEANYSSCKLKAGNICPHRGIDLTPFIKEDGTVICPGHGLRWDTNTGALLPHHAEAANG